MIFKIKYMAHEVVPHVYCRLYVAEQPNMTYAACGNFTVRKEEFEPLQLAMSGVLFEEAELTGASSPSTSSSEDDGSLIAPYGEAPTNF